MICDMSDPDQYWPKAVAHLQAPYDDGASDHIIIAEINDAPHNGYTGVRLVRTALIPLDLVDEVLSTPGGIGYEVKSWGPLPCVSEGQIYDTSFWVDGRKGRNERFQTIINSWNRNDQTVLLPDNVMLMTYGLVPRYLGDGTICWDDPQAPVYEVLRVRSHVNYSGENSNPLGLITIRRDYLEDYCHLKACASVAVYYEERYSFDDATFKPMLKGEEDSLFELPGRQLGMAVLADKHFSAAPQMSRVWGVRLILIPKNRPITDDKDPELIWPGDTEPMTFQRAADTRIYGYVRDEVLQEYESRPEYRIHPESGGVSYGGWWSTDRTFRIGRNHIQVELKKLYEGCPPHVIAHWHRFAVPAEEAQHDRVQCGNRSIARRAKDVIYAYLDLTVSLKGLSDRLGFGLTQDEIGHLDTEEVIYRGWWSLDVAHALFAHVPVRATREQFLNRAVALFKLLELLKPAALRTIGIKLGLPKDQIKEFKSLKLLASLCQLSNIAITNGYSLFEDTDAVVPKWDSKEELPVLRSLFALNGLRICQSHTPSKERDKDVAENIAIFGIDLSALASGWGWAVDALYDRLAADLSEITKLIEDAAW